MAALWEKLFRLKQGLRWWNRRVFGDIFQRVREAEVRVDQTEIDIERDPTPEHRNLLHHAQTDLNWTLAIVEGFWKQKAGSCWVCEGDHNTRYFMRRYMDNGLDLESRLLRLREGKIFLLRQTYRARRSFFSRNYYLLLRSR